MLPDENDSNDKLRFYRREYREYERAKQREKEKLFENVWEPKYWCLAASETPTDFDYLYNKCEIKDLYLFWWAKV